MIIFISLIYFVTIIYIWFNFRRKCFSAFWEFGLEIFEMGLRLLSIFAIYDSVSKHLVDLFMVLTFFKIVFYVLVEPKLLPHFFDWITSEEIQRSYGILNQTMVIGAKLVFYVGMYIYRDYDFMLSKIIEKRQWQSQQDRFYLNSSLVHACATGNLTKVTCLLENFKYVNDSDYGNKAVHEAARNGHMEVLKVLVVHFGDAFDVNLNDCYGNTGDTAIHLAIRSGNVNSVKYLLQQFKDVFDINVSNSTRLGGDTVLHMAASDKDVNMVKALLEHYKDVIDVNKPNNAGDTAIHLATRLRNVNVVKYLLQQFKDIFNINVSNATFNGNTVLHLAARYGTVDMVKAMLEHYKDVIDVNKPNNAGDTAIHLATSFGYLPIVQVLLSNFGMNIDLNLHNKSGLGPLDIAIRKGNRNIVELFIYKTSSPVQVSLLIIAIEQYQPDLAKLIHGKIQKLFKDDIEIRASLSRYFDLSKELLKKNLRQDQRTRFIKDLRVYEIGITKLLKTKYGNVTLLTNYESEPIKEDLQDVAKIIELKNIKQEIASILECPVCFESMNSSRKILACSNDHLICSKCEAKTSINQCPQCREDFIKIKPKRRISCEKIAAIIFHKDNQH
jgi:ankyrin repeat protein